MKIAVVTLVGPAEDYDALTEAGHTLAFGPQRGEAIVRMSEDELADLAGDCEGLIYNVVTARLLERLPNLRFVITPYVGYDKMDIEAGTAAGVLLCNTRTEAQTAGMAEATIALMMASVKRVRLRSERVRAGRWRDDGTEHAVLLHGATVGIVGFGAIGQDVARHLSGWGARLLAHTRTAREDVARGLGVTLVDLPTLLRESDVVTLHVPLSPETEGMIGERELRTMKPTAFLINTARGAVIDDEALCRAVEQGWIAGAALDVFRQEPLPEDSPLRRLDPDRVLIMPHSTSNTLAGRSGTQRKVVESVLEIAEGRVPALALNPGVRMRRPTRA